VANSVSGIERPSALAVFHTRGAVASHRPIGRITDARLPTRRAKTLLVVHDCG
jgi:hypothetical protein